MKRETLITWMFLLVAVLSFIAGFAPILRGRPMNVTFVSAGVVWLVIAVGVTAKTRKRAASKRDQTE